MSSIAIAQSALVDSTLWVTCSFMIFAKTSICSSSQADATAPNDPPPPLCFAQETLGSGDKRALLPGRLSRFHTSKVNNNPLPSPDFYLRARAQLENSLFVRILEVAHNGAGVGSSQGTVCCHAHFGRPLLLLQLQPACSTTTWAKHVWLSVWLKATSLPNALPCVAAGLPAGAAAVNCIGCWYSTVSDCRTPMWRGPALAPGSGRRTCLAVGARGGGFSPRQWRAWWPAVPHRKHTFRRRATGALPMIRSIRDGNLAAPLGRPGIRFFISLYDARKRSEGQRSVGRANPCYRPRNLSECAAERPI